MKVKFMPRGVAKEIISNMQPVNGKAQVMISISDTVDEMKEMMNLHASCGASAPTLFMKFKDYSDEASGFTQEMAESIVGFIDKYRDCEFLVHCYAGISRSGAVSVFINEYLNLNDEMLSSYTQHNLFVFETLMKAAGKPTLKSYYEGLQTPRRRTM